MAKQRRIIRDRAWPEFKPSPEAYWRAATQRFETAVFLLEKSNRYTDAIYLGGYAVECALKALILKRTPKTKLDAVIDEITGGAISHSFDFLSDRLRARNLDIPPDVRRSLVILREQWSTDLRYSGHLTLERPATEFMDRTESVLEWAGRRLDDAAPKTQKIR